MGKNSASFWYKHRTWLHFSPQWTLQLSLVRRHPAWEHISTPPPIELVVKVLLLILTVLVDDGSDIAPLHKKKKIIIIFFLSYLIQTKKFNISKKTQFYGENKFVLFSYHRQLIPRPHSSFRRGTSSCTGNQRRIPLLVSSSSLVNRSVAPGNSSQRQNPVHLSSCWNSSMSIPWNS